CDAVEAEPVGPVGPDAVVGAGQRGRVGDAAGRQDQGEQPRPDEIAAAEVSEHDSLSYGVRVAELPARPAWWPAWVPDVDERGHELRPGRVSRHRCDCADAEHDVFRCGANECRTVY